MNIFLNKIYRKKISQIKTFLLSYKKRGILFFGMIVVFGLITGILFLKQSSDKFSSVNYDLEEMNMEEFPLYVKHKVPFTSQAPSKQWQDKLYQDACEETSIIMATHWINGDEDDISVGQAEMELEKLFEIVKQKHGTAIDMSAEDTAELLREYSKSENIKLIYDVTLEDIIKILAEGNIIITPADGEWLDNKYFVGTGPERHMVVIIGYDYKKRQFITNDPGTNKGKDFIYSFDNLMSSMRNYRTGDKVYIDGEERRVVIVVGR